MDNPRSKGWGGTGEILNQGPLKEAKATHRGRKASGKLLEKLSLDGEQ